MRAASCNEPAHKAIPTTTDDGGRVAALALPRADDF
jgi:hypothetical protein